MADYRRWRVEGATYFFTVVTAARRPIFANPEAIKLLRQKFRAGIRKFPFSIDAIVVLPDHLHSIWTLPQNDGDFAKRWAWIKKEFTKAWLKESEIAAPTSWSQRRHRYRGVWQRRFWEHLIRDEQDFDRHMDYLHYNPVHHGLVGRVRDWKWSSFDRWVERGVYDRAWGCGDRESLNFDDISKSAGE